MPNLLIVDAVDGDLLREALAEHGHDVQIVDTIAEARQAMAIARPDLMILDYGTEGEGLLLLAKLRDMPVIVSSKQKTPTQAVLSLRAGADDFVGKPYDVWELQERIEAVLRRSGYKRPPPPSVLEIGELVIDKKRYLSTVKGESVPLTRTEFRMLLMLAQRAENVVTREESSQLVWGIPDIGHTLDVHCNRLRRKLFAAGLTNPKLATVYGVGHMLTTEGVNV